MLSLLMLWTEDHTCRDPHFSNQVVIFVGSVRRLSKFNSLDRKLEMMSLIADVRGPLYRVKGVDVSRVTMSRLWSASVRSR